MNENQIGLLLLVLCYAVPFVCAHWLWRRWNWQHQERLRRIREGRE